MTNVAKQLKDGPLEEVQEKAKRSKGGPSAATRMVQLAWELDLFRAPDDTTYAVTPISADVLETLPVAERAFRAWLAARYFEAHGKSPSGSAINDAVTTLAGEARRRGAVRPVYIRVAALPDRTVLDLGRDDRLALVIDAAGWRVQAPPADVHLIRRPGMLGLPDPKPGTRTLAKLLQYVTNVKDGEHLMMLTAWLVTALRGRKPFPILSVKGEQGSAKSSGCKAARGLLDPSAAALSMTPKEPRDLAIAASNSYIAGYDNLSRIDDWLSDNLAALSTGAGFRTRALTTDREETIFSAARPVIVNGIPDLVRRGDLADRTLVIELEPISEAERLTEAEVGTRFTEARAEILGLLADAVAQAIREPRRPALLPRMADFACVVESAAPALGWKEGAFLAAYREARDEVSAALLDGDVLAEALEVMRQGRQNFKGSMPELLALLTKHTPEGKRAALPKSARGLGSALRRLAPALRSKGIDFRPSKQGTTRESRARAAEVRFEGVLVADPVHASSPVHACAHVPATQIERVEEEKHNIFTGGYTCTSVHAPDACTPEVDNDIPF